MKKILICAASLVLISSPLSLAHAQDAGPESASEPRSEPRPAMPTALDHDSVAAADPYLWLEDVEGERALAWVETANQHAGNTLEADPRFEPYRERAFEILSAEDRIAMPHVQGGMVWNYWQDAEHPKGIWRRASMDSYRAGTPQWETVLDLDALAATEDQDWVWKGADCLGPDERYCLVALSDGGKDAVVIREFDTQSGDFRVDGFQLPEGKHRYEWLDADTLLVATDFGEIDGQPSLTESGYPYIIRALSRGQSLDQASEVFRGDQGDGGYGVSPIVFRGPEGAVEGIFIHRPLDTFRSEIYALIGAEPVQLGLPERVAIHGMLDDRLIFTVEEDWSLHGVQLPSGTLASATLQQLGVPSSEGGDPVDERALIIFDPGERGTIDGVAMTRSGVVVSHYENVQGQLTLFQPATDDGADDAPRWVAREVSIPDNSAVSLVDASRGSNQLFYTVEGFLTPTTLMWVDQANGETQSIQQSPARFDASTHVVEQFVATSRDGTSIPYFVVRPREMSLDGSNPTILYGYGGFLISKPADYIPEMGALWLENGGVYVVANIRGGGEFGPSWHQAALRENRQRAFDDFAAVAQDLIDRQITSPAHLGIYGRSNGGVLTSVSITQRPELFNAAVIESPLIDMLRYHLLPAGASWIGEYGDPRVPGDAAFIAAYSGYQNVDANADYPRVYITTNTHDDRVHPGHARKFAARLAEFGYDPLYFEDTTGGHSFDADPVKNARRWARHYVYFAQQLMD